MPNPRAQKNANLRSTATGVYDAVTQGLLPMLGNAARGSVAATLGAPGDILGLLSDKQPLPTSQNILDYIPPVGSDKALTGMAETMGGFVPAPGSAGLVRAAKTAANPMTYGRAFMEAQAPAVKSQIFAGPNSKIWNAADADAFKQMEAKGASYSDMAGKTGMSRNVQGLLTKEIDDSASSLKMAPTDQDLQQGGLTLGSLLDHPELFKAYPQLSSMPIKANKSPNATAFYSPKDSSISLREVGSSPAQMNDAKSTLLHETQHAIQDIEDWAYGANQNPLLLDYLISKSGDIEKQPFTKGKTEFDRIGDKLNPMYQLDTISSYLKAQNNMNIKPSAVTNDSLWYKYSDDIRQFLGPMPKKPGIDRTRWLQDASAYKLRRYFDDKGIPDWKQADLIKEAESFSRSKMNYLWNKQRQYYDDNLNYMAVGRKTDRLNKMSNFDRYNRAGGEAQARLVQTREDLPMSDRLSIDPMTQLDVPSDEIYGVPFSQVLRNFGVR